MKNMRLLEWKRPPGVWLAHVHLYHHHHHYKPVPPPQLLIPFFGCLSNELCRLDSVAQWAPNWHTHTPGKTSDKKENTAQKPTGVSETYKNPLKDTAETEKSLTPFSVRNKRQIEDVFSDAITTALKTSATTTTSSTSNNNKHQKCRSFSLLL